MVEVRTQYAKKNQTLKMETILKIFLVAYLSTTSA